MPLSHILIYESPLKPSVAPFMDQPRQPDHDKPDAKQIEHGDWNSRRQLWLVE
jgi:hypothetical protein